MSSRIPLVVRTREPQLRRNLLAGAVLGVRPSALVRIVPVIVGRRRAATTQTPLAGNKRRAGICRRSARACVVPGARASSTTGTSAVVRTNHFIEYAVELAHQACD